jgi:hypothetical protein
VFILFFSCQLKLSVEDFGIDCEAKQIMLLLGSSTIKISVTAWFVFPPQLILTNPAEEHQKGFIGTTVRHSRAPLGCKALSFLHFHSIHVIFLFVSIFSLFIEGYR